MSLTLMPAVDVRDGKAVRLRQGESGSETDYGSPFEAARTWVEAGAEWIHLVDLDAAFGTGNNRDQLREIVHELGDRVNIELSGGVRDDASLDAALEAGAARVNIGTAALENPDWTASVIKKYGDRVAVGLDVRGHTLAARGWTREHTCMVLLEQGLFAGEHEMSHGFENPEVDVLSEAIHALQALPAGAEFG